MSDGFSVKVSGVAEIQRRMQDQVPKVEKRVVSAGLRAAARPVVTRARSLVPRDTGQLRKSIGVKVKRYRGAVWVGIGPRAGYKIRTADGRSLNPTQYAHLVERGTVHQRAQPFLRPAIDATKSEQMRAFIAKAREQFSRINT